MTTSISSAATNPPRTRRTQGTRMLVFHAHAELYWPHWRRDRCRSPKFPRPHGRQALHGVLRRRLERRVGGPHEQRGRHPHRRNAYLQATTDDCTHDDGDQRDHPSHDQGKRTSTSQRTSDMVEEGKNTDASTRSRRPQSDSAAPVHTQLQTTTTTDDPTLRCGHTNSNASVHSAPTAWCGPSNSTQTEPIAASTWTTRREPHHKAYLPTSPPSYREPRCGKAHSFEEGHQQRRGNGKDLPGFPPSGRRRHPRTAATNTTAPWSAP